jgi:hypothetical protein
LTLGVLWLPTLRRIDKVILIQSSLMLKSLAVLRTKYWRHFGMKFSSAYPLTLQPVLVHSIAAVCHCVIAAHHW